MEHAHPPFYGSEIIRRNEQGYINQILSKYKDLPPTDELKKKIYDELMMEKYKGNIKIPFKVAMRLDPAGNFPPYIEVILDTKV